LLLLFTIGLKLNIKSLASPHVYGVAALHMLIVVVLTVPVIMAAGFLIPVLDIEDSVAVWTLAFALSFSSTVFAVKIFDERGESASMHASIAIGILVIQDLLLEAVGNDGPHTTEEVSYMVFEAGNYALADGTKFEIGLTDSTSIQGPNADGDFHAVTFNQRFNGRPVLLTQVQTDNNNLLVGDGALNRPAFLDTRTDNISADSFDVAIERYESIGAAVILPANEQIGYFAIESGSGQWSTNADDSAFLNFIAGSETAIDSVGTPNETVVNYGQDLTTAVNRFAAISSYNDNDPAQLRLDNDSATNMQLFIEEERSSGISRRSNT